MNKQRTPYYRRLWSLVRELPGGEEAMRDMISLIRAEDGTGRELAGTRDYVSTKLLSLEQLRRLIDMIAEKLPQRPRRRSEFGNVTFLAAPREVRFITRLAAALGWPPEGLEAFVRRQTSGRGLKTHDDVQRVLVPLQHIAQRHGFRFINAGGRKLFLPPNSQGETK
jgi:hypothetical protein